MIIYATDKLGFAHDLPTLHTTLKTTIFNALGDAVSANEVLSWKNSLNFMMKIVSDERIPNDAGIVVEYNIPVTQNRIDFIITGLDDLNNKQAVLIELKQWSKVFVTDMDAIVATYYAHHQLKEVAHPSYQVTSYASLLYDYKPIVQTHEITQHPCTYLHNHIDDNTVTNDFYQKYTKIAPVFCKGDEQQLKDFICKYIRKGCRGIG